MKEVTIYDIAKALMLSASTVSRALRKDPLVNVATQQRVIAHADKVGYRSNAFARNLSNRRTHTIGVIVPRLDSVFMSACLAGMEEVAREQGYDLLITQSQESVQREEENAKLLFDKRVDGLLISLAREGGDLNYFKAYREKNVPLIFFDRVPEEDGHKRCVIDNEALAHEATMHLLDQGCRQLAHLTICSPLNVYRDRVKGFERAIRESGYARGRVICLDELKLQNGRKSAGEIMTAGIDGIFSANDQAATGCMLELMEQGIRIPEDMAVVGFNNEEVCSIVSPNLSSVEYPGRETGQRAMSAMLKALRDKENTNEKECMPGRLVIRASSLRK